jgi:hypothetical protein
MQYSWASAIVIIMLLGTVAAFVSPRSTRRKLSTSFWIQVGTTVAIAAVLGHNVFWERTLNPQASRGWTLLYTLPAFLICFTLSVVLAIVFAVSHRKP